MADAILSFAVESIGKLLIEEADFLQGVSDKVNQLHDDLKRMERFLKYADTKQSTRESVQPWSSEFKALAYEANDLVEDYVFRVVSQNKKGFTNTLKRYACIFGEWHTHHNLRTEIENLRGRIFDLTKNFGDYGVPAIIEGEGSSSMQQQLRRAYSFYSKSEEDFVGLESDVNQLVKYLENEDKFSMVSIYGMGGIGKTTLAKKVYHRIKEGKQFQGFAWFWIPQHRSTKEILQEILVNLVPEQESQIMGRGEERLAEQLREILQGRRCLIVLDDIWSNDTWDCIKPAFCISENGSKILLTTRNRDVAEHVDPNGYHHQPRYLNEDESWELLKRKSLKNIPARDVEDYHKLEELGKKMVKYCRGLPLAVVVLGGILQRKKSLEDWSIVHNNIKSYIGRGKNIGQVEGEVPKILAFSYYDLPYKLKSCFLYLGKFKEDSDIEIERLYQLWIAEGMVLASDRIGQETMMDVAERYLEELAKRSMVQVELHEEGQPTITKFKSCQLHDLMRDLCLDKAQEENLYKLIDLGRQNIGVPLANYSRALERHYRLVCRSFGNEIDKYIPPPKEETKHLRTLWYEQGGGGRRRCDGKSLMSQVNNFQMLRVLIIEGYDMGSKMFQPRCCYSMSPLECIGHLIHLRYLSLRYSKIFHLPSSLGNLNYLETLDLRHIECCRKTNEIWKLGRLRQLYLSDFGLKLQLDRLNQQLEILESVSNMNCDLKDLSKLTNLRALKVRVDNNLEAVEQIISHISSLNYIRFTSLEIWYCDLVIDSNSENNKGLAVLEHLLFCKNLHELKIVGILCKQIPSYQPHLFPSPGLSELTLEMSKIEEDPMPTLEKFPKLRKLYLNSNSFVGKKMICRAKGFPQLKVLEINYLKNLEEWKVDEGAMPKLSSLEIWGCEKLKMISDGLRSITTLSEITIGCMPEEFMNTVHIVNGIEGPDFDKKSHMPSVKVYGRGPSASSQ